MSRRKIGIFGWLGCCCMIGCSSGSDWSAIDVQKSAYYYYYYYYYLLLLLSSSSSSTTTTTTTTSLLSVHHKRNQFLSYTLNSCCQLSWLIDWSTNWPIVFVCSVTDRPPLLKYTRPQLRYQRSLCRLSRRNGTCIPHSLHSTIPNASSLALDTMTIRFYRTTLCTARSLLSCGVRLSVCHVGVLCRNG